MNSASRGGDRFRIVVLGYIVRGPLGGPAWHHLQYVMGLATLGHDVYFMEDSDDVPWSCYDPVRNVTDTDPSYALENIGSAGCSIPDDGFPWRAIRQPIVLDASPVTPGPANGKFTTVMQSDSYPAKEHRGRRYGMKSDSFGPYLNHPGQVEVPLELALGSLSAPHEHLQEHGWWVIDPREPTHDPWTYQRNLQRSRGEFGVAKHGYVTAQSGWFRERTAGYLACGRPAVVQDTGFSDWLPTGEGVLAFRSLEEAVEGIRDATTRYEQQCRAARALAEEYFEAGKVLTRLLESAIRFTPSSTGRGLRR